MRVQREVDSIERQLNPKNKKSSRSSRKKKRRTSLRRQKELKVQVKARPTSSRRRPSS